VDTGEKIMTGGRLKREAPYLNNETICFTRDGLTNADIGALIQFHKKQRTLTKVTSVQPPGRFGALSMEDNKIVTFEEKPQGDGSWVPGGFFVLSPKFWITFMTCP